MTTDEPRAMCTAAWWDGVLAPLYCSRLAHARGKHAAHRGHDLKQVPPMRTWPYERDDQEAYAEHVKEVDRLVALDKDGLWEIDAKITQARIQAMTGRGDPRTLPQLARMREQVEEAQARRFLA